MATESQLPYRQVNICASLEMTTKWIPASKPPISPSLTKNYDLFMQNEPNFGKAQMNVNVFPTKDYENKSNWTLGENEPKTNPIKANFKCPQTHQGSGKKKGCQELFLGISCRKGYNVVNGKSHFSVKFGESSFKCLLFWSLWL
jgi:hypothetical protein